MLESVDFGKAMFIVVLMFVLGAGVGNGVTRWWYQSDAVKRDFAEFNQKTGEWQWKEPSPAAR